MRDVLMIALMIASILVFAAYVTWCDRIIGRSDTDVGGAESAAPGRDLEGAA